MSRPVRPSAAARHTARDVADLAAAYTAELSTLAKEARLELLAYLLDMAHLEAVRLIRETPPASRRGAARLPGPDAD